MERGWYTRVLFVLGALGLAAFFLYPSYYYFNGASQAEKDSHELFCEAMPDWMTCNKFNLGLDLQGGIHLVMGVGVDKAVEQRADRLADSLQAGLTEEGLPFEKIERPRGTAIIKVVLKPATDMDRLTPYLRKYYGNLDIVSRDQALYELELSDGYKDEVKRLAVEQTIKTLRNRADQFGVTEPTIARRGESNILIQLPGVKDPERAMDMIGRTAQLEFKIVDAAASQVLSEIAAGPLPADVRLETARSAKGPEYFLVLPERAKEAVRALVEPKLAEDRMVGFGAVDREEGMLRTYLLHSRPGITGDYLIDARAEQNPDLPSDYRVAMTFDQKGAKIFEELTGNNVQNGMAIVLDDVVSSAPTIQGRIPGGRAIITLGGVGNPQQKFNEANDLSLVLKAGALPAPVEIREKREVGKTLGAESVEKGATAIMLGSLLVLVFMFLYYRQSGLIANFALVLNVFLVMAVLAMFEATLTLPGMAGIVLTIGMAVDANVIIFERIGEELRIGKTPRAAIEAGYAKAFSTIMDANITTLIAGVVLMQYGSGPVRGFAVTLIIGIVCSVFTAIVVTRLCFDFISQRRRLETLSI